MRKFYFLLALVFGLGGLNAQNPELFDTWYLREIQMELTPTIYINEYEPSISPALVINDDLTFEGIAACNSFNGSFTFNDSDDDIYFTNYASTDLSCETDDLNDFEIIYAYLFSEEEHLPMWVWENPQTEELELWFGSSAGIAYRFTKTPLMANENVEITFNPIYPNPASDFIVIENAETNSEFQIFDFSGRLISQGKIDSQNKIDVSSLEKGNYILKMNGKNHRFIKK